MVYQRIYHRSIEFSRIAYDSLKLFALFHLGFTYGYSFSYCVGMFLSITILLLTRPLGPSMLPTVNESGDLVIVDNFSYKILSKDFKKGDVVISICPTQRNKLVCKRIIATEGDRIPTTPLMQSHRSMLHVPVGHVWLAGDNPKNSTDSRYYGPVSVGLLQGRVICKITPNLSNPIQLIHSEEPAWLQKSRRS